MRHCCTTAACVVIIAFFGHAESPRDFSAAGRSAVGNSAAVLDSLETAAARMVSDVAVDSSVIDTARSATADSPSALTPAANPASQDISDISSADTLRRNRPDTPLLLETGRNGGRGSVKGRFGALLHQKSGTQRRRWIQSLLARYMLHGIILLISLSVIALTAAFFLGKRDKERFLTTTRLSVVDKEVRRACNFIEKNFSNPGLSPENICNAMVTGRAFLEALFHRELGMSLEEFIAQVRMNRARILLTRTPDMTVDTLAESVGYTDIDDFTAAFSKITGVTLDEYRKHI